MLLCLLIVLYKLLTNQNFSIGFRVGIQSNRDDTQNLVFEPVLLRRQGQTPVINRNGNNSNTATTSDAQVETKLTLLPSKFVTISDNSILKVNNMPPKGRRVHNTRSVSGTCSRANSPLVVKVNNDMAKAKQPKQTKAKLKSIVKVVKNTTDAAATKKVSFRQGPAPPADHQPVEQPAVPPRQTAFADAMARWKLSMVAAINSCPSPSTSGDQDNQGPQGNNVLLQQSSAVVPEDRSRDHTVQTPVYGQPAMVAPRDAHGGFGTGPGDQDSLDISQPLPPGHVGSDLGVGPTDMEMDDEDNPPPPPAGRPNSHPVAAASAPQGLWN